MITLASSVQDNQDYRHLEAVGKVKGPRRQPEARHSIPVIPCVCGVEESLSFVATEELGVSLRLVNGTGGSPNRKVWHF